MATRLWDVEQTIAFFALGGIARELARTTSLLERTNREVRRKFRQACCFSSRRGADVAIDLQVQGSMPAGPKRPGLKPLVRSL